MTKSFPITRTLLLGVPAFLCGGLGLTEVAEAQDPERNLGSYHLFDPVPDDRLREMSTDRPDTTESAYTVPAGHVQIEMDVAVLSLDELDGVRSTEVTLVPMNLKVGLAQFADLQVVLEPYHTRTESSGNVPTTTEEGFGETQVRLKLNAFGNDEGDVALAFMPFVAYHDGVVEGGLITPFAAALPYEFGFGAQLEADVVAQEGGAYGFELAGAATVGRDIVGPLAGYVEIAFWYSTYDLSQSRINVDGGLTYGVTDDFQLDMGTRVGAFGPINDVELFLGMSARR